ncbi:hypothetical protein [Herbaspirillum huttiense]|uniref:hypothetical protein n=1 Tax=Herbaspirillum huttiense TaxID=863372 RepID=UPI0031E03A16
MSNQWIRKANLIVSSGTNGLDLSELRFQFQTRASDVSTPNTLHARIYNVKSDTAESLRKREFTNITLQAGYENGKFGIIFSGEIKQVAIGRERNVDGFIDVWAADTDRWHNFSVLNKSISAGATPKDILDAIVSYQSANGVAPVKYASDVTGLIEGAALGVAQTLIRGKVLFGLSRDYVRDWAKTHEFWWSLQNGKFVLTPVTGYRVGEPIVISSATGMVGIPEAQTGGVKVRTLLNPEIAIGRLVQIAQSDINRVVMQKNGLQYNAAASAVPTTAAGFYRVMLAESQGDTRGTPWYTDLTCLGIDITAPDSNSSVVTN